MFLWGRHVGTVHRQKEKKGERGRGRIRRKREKDDTEQGRVGAMLANTKSEYIRSGQHG